MAYQDFEPKEVFTTEQIANEVLRDEARATRQPLWTDNASYGRYQGSDPMGDIADGWELLEWEAPQKIKPAQSRTYMLQTYETSFNYGDINF